MLSEERIHHWQKNFDLTDMVLTENLELGESIQSSMASGALPHINYGRNEWALNAFGNTVDKMI